MIKAIFFGTPTIATPFLRALIEATDIDIVAIVTQPDKPVGRKAVITPSPIANLAEEHDILVLKPTKLKDASFIEALSSQQPDLFIVFAYGRIIPQEILDIPRLGAINVHPSKLPLLRGPSPIQSAIAQNLDETAISIMLMDSGMDSGPILAQMIAPLTKSDTSETLAEMVMKKGPDLLIDTVRSYIEGDIKPINQNNEEATFCKMIDKTDGYIDPRSESAISIYAKWRAYSKWPKIRIQTSLGELILTKISVGDAQGVVKEGQIVFIDGELLLGTTEGTIRIHTIQRAGSSEVPARDFVNGLRSASGLENQLVTEVR